MLHVGNGADVGPLLEERGRRGGIPQLVPADAGLVSGGVDGVIENDRFVIAVVAVGDAIHQAVADAVEPDVGRRVRRCSGRRIGDRLRHAWPRAESDGDREEGSAELTVEWSNRHVGRPGDGQRRRAAPDRPHFPDVNGVADRAVAVGRTLLYDDRRRATRRRREAVEIGRQRAAVDECARHALAEVVELIRSRKAGQHAGPVVNVEALKEALIGSELVGGDVVAIRPDADVRIVDEESRIGGGGCREVVEVVRAERIAAHRDGDALVRVRAVGGADGKLRQHPAVGEQVVFGDGVAVVVRGARPAEALKERVAFDGTVEQFAGLVVDGQLGVDPLDVVVPADAAGGVGRRGVRDADAIEVDTDDVGRASRIQGALHDGIRGHRSRCRFPRHGVIGHEVGNFGRVGGGQRKPERR